MANYNGNIGGGSSHSRSGYWREMPIGLSLSLLLVVAGILVAKLIGRRSQRGWAGKNPTTAKPKKEQLPPGSFGWPLIGETLELRRALRAGRPWTFFEERIGRYGETFKTSLLGRPMVVLASPAGNKAVFTHADVAWPASAVAVAGPASLIGQAGPGAERVCAALLAFLRPDALQHYTGPIEAIIGSFVEEHLLHQACVIELFPLMKRLTFAIACGVLLGCGDDAPDQRSLLHLFHTMTKGLFHLPINLPGTPYRKALAASPAIRERLQVWIDRRRLELTAARSHRPDILSHLIQYNACPDDDPQRATSTTSTSTTSTFSDNEIKDIVLHLIFAGHDSSTVVAAMTCKYLASHPAIMDAVYKENAEVAASKARGEHLSWGDLRRMKLSWRVVQESMRLTPPANTMLRRATHETSFGGFRIPESWTIMWTPDSTHRNPKYFPEPDKFDPSRFEGTGPAPFTFVPFGGGPRMCPGNEFARMEILLILHHLVTHFSWTLVDPDEPIIIDPMPFPANNLPVVFQPRNPTI